jgi:hypothetical protein
VETLHRTYRDRADTVFVYVAEAHPVDEWQMEANEEEGVLLRQHTSLEERQEAARLTAGRLGLTMPVLVDTMDDAASVAFAAWPERIYVADPEGRIAYAGEPGPWGFEPEAAAAALDTLLDT